MPSKKYVLAPECKGQISFIVGKIKPTPVWDKIKSTFFNNGYHLKYQNTVAFDFDLLDDDDLDILFGICLPPTVTKIIQRENQETVEFTEQTSAEIDYLAAAILEIHAMSLLKDLISVEDYLDRLSVIHLLATKSLNLFTTKENVTLCAHVE